MELKTVITFDVEPMTADLMRELYPIMSLCWDENPIKGEVLEIDWVYFSELSNRGSLVVIVVREGLEAIGFAIIILSRSSHNISLVSATVDSIMLLKEKRKGTTGARFIDFLVYVSKKCQADELVISVRPTNDYSLLLLNKKFEEIEVVYRRSLNGKGS